MLPKINILIVDDHHFFIDGMQNHLKSINFINKIYAAPDGLEAISIIKTKKIDVVISDVNMPGMNGLELTKHIKKSKPEIKVIVVTQFIDTDHILALTRSKPDAVIDKIDAKSDLEEAVKKVLSGKVFYSTEVQKLLIEKTINNKTAKVTGIIPHLTPREKILLPYFAQGLNNKKCAVHLEKTHKIIISKNTVEGHRKNIYLKLEVHNAAQLAHKAKELGLID